MARKIRHRGPDWSGIFASDRAILAHERLAIVDPASGRQPLFSPDQQVVLAVNGEIYNHRALREGYASQFDFQTESDCEVILALYQEKGPAFLEDLNGIFAFALYDQAQDRYLIGRDHMGIIPLYMGWDQAGRFYVASELKALEGTCTKIEEFPPGSFLDSQVGEIQSWYERDWMAYRAVEDQSSDVMELQDALEASVHRQLMSDVPYGVLLSGGLDSSITSALAKRYSARRELHSFAIGLEGSPDLAAAQEVADHIGSIHHQVHFTVEEGIDALRDVVYHLETYDVTTIRASTPMYLLARVIKSMGIKMVLSGEGADEIFGGYLYFHKAPDAQAFHEETVRKIGRLHLYDCLRANKSMAAWGIETRVPFLDKEFMDVAMRLQPEDKMIKDGKMEKHILREAFADLLPDSVAWRQKEQFSDGVGYSWIDSLKALAEEKISDQDMERAAFRFPINTPQNKEEYHYRLLFEEHFPSETAAKCALAWSESFRNQNDPSGRAILGVHVEAYTGDAEASPA
ncbi:UNVERIFIED_CONTAM: hypothetical protein GTU68_052070 [Idotea baltica]|nr:hypothetical protein [Idotea baltica]